MALFKNILNKGGSKMGHEYSLADIAAANGTNDGMNALWNNP